MRAIFLLPLSYFFSLLTTQILANNPPTAPTADFPANGATMVFPETNFVQWGISTDSDGDEIQYDFYFGTTPDPPLLKENLFHGWYQVGDQIEFVSLIGGDVLEYRTSGVFVTPETTYYWKMVAKDGKGGETSSEVFSFTTARENTLPSKPVSLYPANGADDISKDVTLSWPVSTDPDGDPITYNVYVGRASNTLQQVATGLTVTEFELSDLEDQGFYFWRVAAVDGYNGFLSTSDIHSFQVENYIPDRPVRGNLQSPADGRTNTTFNVNFKWEVATDKDNDLLTYDLYVGQDPIPQNLVASNLTTNTYSHRLKDYGLHYWTVVVKDGTGFSENYPVFSFTTWSYAPDFSIETIYVEGGTFTMGSDLEEDERPPHEVRLDDFKIAKYEVINQHYVAFLNCIVENTGLIDSFRAHGRLSFPYKNVTYNGRPLCQVFDATRTDRPLGYEETYDSPIIWNGTSFELDPTFENHPVKYMLYDGAALFVRWLGNNYRLPTEAEWEYAAMGGKLSEGYKYSGSDDYNEVAAHNLDVWVDLPRYTSPVGQYLPNELGIFDMTGNVQEICKDYYSPTFYGISPADNPLNTEPVGFLGRVVRGGSHIGPLRVKDRGYLAVQQYINHTGIRLVQTVVPEPPKLSGAVMSGDGNPLEGVRLTGFSETIYSDADGQFSTTEGSGWSGTIVPVLEGYTFIPESIEVTDLTAPVNNLNFEGTPVIYSFTLSGSISLEGRALEGVAIKGFEEMIHTDTDGLFSAIVSVDWTGKITPELQNYEFSPASHEITALTENRNDLDFTATYAGNYMISGTISDAADQPIARVLLEGFPNTTFTDDAGYYEAEVPAGWSGAITPLKDDYTFVPEQKTFTNVQERLSGQNFQKAVVSSLGDEKRNFVKVYPNPTNGGTIIRIEKRISNPFTIEITTLQGELIRKYTLDSNTSQIYWNGNNESGMPCPSGVYQCRIINDKRIVGTIKIVVIK